MLQKCKLKCYFLKKILSMTIVLIIVKFVIDIFSTSNVNKSI